MPRDAGVTIAVRSNVGIVRFPIHLTETILVPNSGRQSTCSELPHQLTLIHYTYLKYDDPFLCR